MTHEVKFEAHEITGILAALGFAVSRLSEGIIGSAGLDTAVEKLLAARAEFSTEEIAAIAKRAEEMLDARPWLREKVLAAEAAMAEARAFEGGESA